MAEQIDLTTPEVKPSNPRYELERLTLDIKAKTITVQLLGANGEAKSVTYGPLTNPTGAALLSSLNTSNNSAGTSLIKRVYTRIISDGVFNGSVSGTAD